MKKTNKINIIKQVSSTPLSFKKLNESAGLDDKSDKYIFSGVFTQCSVPGHVVINRNNRSYPEKTVLAHLAYLRETIKDQGCLLGELDHPDGRFDIQLKEASHKITDLWYDQNTHCVMGKLELLDTPNGQIAKKLVESNYPLFVSSRAAGDVDEKTHEVEIMQIFTYDIVCTPGFAEARLERVNESLGADVKNYLNESAKCVYNDGLCICECTENINKIKTSKKLDMANLCKPLLEDDEPKEDGNNSEFQLPTMNTNPNDDNSSKNESDGDDTGDTAGNEIETNTEEDQDEKKKLILGITGEDEDGNIIGDEDSDAKENDEDSKRDLILSIETEEKPDETQSDSDDEEKEQEAQDQVQEETAEKSKIEKQTDEDVDKYEALINEVEKEESVKESIIRRYPFSISLSESNFAKFAALRPKQKKKCADFIVTHEIYDIQSINELWSTPLREEKRVQENWLKLASQSDIDLYVKAPMEVQDAIEETAKYVIMETKEDVDEFWARTGLRQAAARKRMNEEFVNNYVNPVQQMNETKNSKYAQLGYNMDYIKMTEDWFNNDSEY